MVGVIIGLRFARHARDDAIDPVAVIRLLGLQGEAELFAHDPCPYRKPYPRGERL